MPTGLSAPPAWGTTEKSLRVPSSDGFNTLGHIHSAEALGLSDFYKSMTVYDIICNVHHFGVR